MRSENPIWSPSAARVAQANMTRFMRLVEAEGAPEKLLGPSANRQGPEVELCSRPSIAHT
ncbi:MAG: hypothetical protein ACREX9_20500 [Gammaproteobacteria bacterium]